VTVATVGNGKFAEISVADTGPGVSQDAAERIFDPFFSMRLGTIAELASIP
jgi:signal transduction histidine kinase